MMKHVASPIIIFATFVLSLLLPRRSDADPTRGNGSASNDYSYHFKDDPLAAGGLGVNDARIQIASHVVRTTLIRPRTAFVAELLKTVESL